MVVCVDTSFLFSLYGDDANSARAREWISARKCRLVLSAYNEFEFGNALRFAESRAAIAVGDAAKFWSEYEADRNRGRLLVRELNLARVVDEACRLSAGYTLSGGHRGFDILLVAAALVAGATDFLTFDGNQRKLAIAERLECSL